MVVCNNDIWFKNPLELMCSTDVIPTTNMTVNKQLNALTRLCIVLFFILLLIRPRQDSYMFGGTILFTVILLYLFQSDDPVQIPAQKALVERYEPLKAPQYIADTRSNSGIVLKGKKLSVTDPSTYRLAEDDVLLKFNDPDFFSYNQALVGPANPKTRIAPVIVPPSHDLSYWKANNLVNHSSINRESQQDFEQSGFLITSCSGEKTSKGEGIVEGFTMDFPTQMKPRYSKAGGDTITMNKSCGYKEKKKIGLPVNTTTGECDSDEVFTDFNTNLHTEEIDTDIYYRNEVNEPIMSNIGISMTPQIGVVSVKKLPDGGTLYTENGDAVDKPIVSEEFTVNESNVYDPRFNGYGTSYRSYVDDVTGQPRFMYDDIDSVRRPNYLVRSNIDTQSAADHYGPIPEGHEAGNPSTSDMHELANQSYTDSVIQFRSGMMESLMRKRNSELWQLRVAPLASGGQRMLGGMGLGASPGL